MLKEKKEDPRFKSVGKDKGNYENFELRKQVEEL